jgi:hypothetical protein
MNVGLDPADLVDEHARGVDAPPPQVVVDELLDIGGEERGALLVCQVRWRLISA